MFENITETDFAYLAGFIDGEGCFFIGLFQMKSRPDAPSYPNYQTYIKICNTDKYVMDWIAETFHGTNYNQWKSTDRKREFEREIFNIQFTGQTLTQIIPRIFPYLKVKKPHAEIMMKMRETFPTKRGKTFVSEETWKIREELHHALRKINSRFHDHILKQP